MRSFAVGSPTKGNFPLLTFAVGGFTVGISVARLNLCIKSSSKKHSPLVFVNGYFTAKILLWMILPSEISIIHPFCREKNYWQKGWPEISPSAVSPPTVSPPALLPPTVLPLDSFTADSFNAKIFVTSCFAASSFTAGHFYHRQIHRQQFRRFRRFWVFFFLIVAFTQSSLSDFFL